MGRARSATPEEASSSRPLRNGGSAWSEIAARLKTDPLIDTPDALLSPATVKQIAEALRHVVRQELWRPLVDNLPHQPPPALGQHGEPPPPARVSVGQLLTAACGEDVGGEQGPSAPPTPRHGPPDRSASGAEAASAGTGGALAGIHAELCASASPGAHAGGAAPRAAAVAEVSGRAFAPAASAGLGPDPGSQQVAVPFDSRPDIVSGAQEEAADPGAGQQIPRAGRLNSMSSGSAPPSRARLDLVLPHDASWRSGAQSRSPTDASTRRRRWKESLLDDHTGGSTFTQVYVEKLINKYRNNKNRGPFSFRGARDIKQQLWWVRTSTFGTVVSGIIILNAVYIAVQTSVVLHNTRLNIYVNPKGRSWVAGDAIFAFLFLAEVALRVLAYQVRFFNGTPKYWNMFDCMTLVGTLIALGVDVAETSANFYVNFFKMLRLVRLVRSLKASRSRYFHTVKTLMYTMAGSANAFLSSVLLVVIVVSVFGTTFMHGLQNYLVEVQAVDVDGRRLQQDGAGMGGTGGVDDVGGTVEDVQTKLDTFFGSFSRSFFTLVACISGGMDWKEVSTALEEIGEMYKWFFVVYIMFTFLCVLNILNGVFVNAAIESAQSNKELAVENTHHKRKALIQQMVKWFVEADKDASGTISWDELREIMADHEVRTFLLASGIDVASAGEIFLLVDEDRTGVLEPVEFVDHLIALQGEAKALDMASLRRVCEEISEKVEKMESKLLDHAHGLNRAGDHLDGPAAAVQPAPRIDI